MADSSLCLPLRVQNILIYLLTSIFTNTSMIAIMIISLGDTCVPAKTSVNKNKGLGSVFSLLTFNKHYKVIVINFDTQVLKSQYNILCLTERIKAK